MYLYIHTIAIQLYSYIAISLYSYIAIWSYVAKTLHVSRSLVFLIRRLLAFHAIVGIQIEA